jgi:Big-like domain-containing protein/HYR domain-containing protein
MSNTKISHTQFIASSGRAFSAVSVALGLLILAAPSRLHAQSSAAQMNRPAKQALTAQTLARVLSFEKTPGGSDAQFVARGRRSRLVLEKNSAVLAFGHKSAAPTQAPEHVFRIGFAGANREPILSGEKKLPGKIYHADANSRGTLEGNPTFRRVRYSQLYHGIDAVFYGNEHDFEFDFEIAPHARPEQIRLSLAGTEKVLLEPSGDLSLSAAGEQVWLKKPVIYQEHNGVRNQIAGSYTIGERNKDEVVIRLGRYDHSLPLIIDPSFSFGSPQGDEGIFGFESNSKGEVFVLGETFDQAHFPATFVQPGPFQQFSQACFLTKLNSSLTSVEYSIIFDASGCGNALAVSPGGVAYLTGSVFNSTLGVWNGVVVSVDDSSGSPNINTFPLINYDEVDAMAVNGSGNVFLLGPCRLVQPGDPPLQLNGFNTQPYPAHDVYSDGCTGSPLDPNLWREPLLSVFDPQGNFLYGSLLSPQEFVFAGASGYSMAADDSGRAYILGWTTTPITVTADAYQSQCATTCPHLTVVDTTVTGAASLAYSSYLWQTLGSLEGSAVRIGPDSSVYLAMAAAVLGDYPQTPPTSPYQPFAYDDDGFFEATELARFTLGSTGTPNQLKYALLFDPRVELNGPGASVTFGHWMSGLRLLPSGAIAVNTAMGANSNAGDTDVVDIFYPSAQFRAPLIVNQLWNTNAAPNLGGQIAADTSGNLYLARNVINAPSTQADVEVDLLANADPGSNTPPAIQVPSDFSIQAAANAGAFVTFAVSAFDAEDGAIAFSCNFSSGTVFAIGATTVTCSTTDSGGLSVSGSFTVTVTPPSTASQTTTSLVSSINPSTVGQSVTFTATVSSISGAIPNGEMVTFTDGGNAIGAASLASGSASLTTSALTIGSHTITASYPGDQNSLGSTSPALQEAVNPVASGIKLASSLNPSTVGQSVTFTATVTGLIPTGNVTFFDGASTIGNPMALSGGSASLTTNALTVGSHTITASYGGDANNMGSTSSALTEMVNPLTPAQMLVGLIATFQAMNIPKQGTSLTDQLQQVATDIATQNGLACEDLVTFASHVNAQRGKTITNTQANQLLAAVTSLKSALNCGP